jgi:hypothetical protein
MKKLLFGAAIVALTASTAYADDQERRAAGAIGAGTTGAIGGAVIGGPVGAVIGGVAGATIGAAAAVPAEAQTYVVEHPVESVRIEGQIAPRYRLPATVAVHEIPNAPGFGYIYVDERPVIVSMETREVVHVLR